ncbi:glycosyltransferase [Polynucleobacter sp. MWH-Braz-FAM2G]|uniref:glycosyltransferase n=1 Tax=Polynucleobacter sp. MWH-Braz-FAM2G TaxID=1855883 RepID=UPI001BFE804B|nr:glycosyltransferase [Polynucleobacter sp. MWH-Braz-FAM2G]QWD91111.1 glycosyltransferase [Polynucleobacter sp. MWH-Braz-FAM2G]
MNASIDDSPITISVVIPVYRGESSLPGLIQEISTFTNGIHHSPKGIAFTIKEVLLIHDSGPDRSDRVLEELAEQYRFVKPIWLSRNFGQHAATLAGMASAAGNWVVTMDEDGQQNPHEIGAMLDIAVEGNFQIIYAQPINPPPHGVFRNFCSKFAKKLALQFLGAQYQSGVFNSFRLIEGEIARILAAYCGNGVYLDVALFWIANRVGYAPMLLRGEDRPSSYSFGMLLNHFWRMVLTSGTRPLRLITIMGGISFFLALFLSGYALYSKFIESTPIQGWTSLLIIISFFSGLIMVSLGVVAEYLALTTGIVMGKPLYVVTSKPTRPSK